jgi:hypothetical protein
LAELSQQRYAGGSGWESPGDDAYIAAHDRGMADLQLMLRDEGSLTIVATVPPLLRGENYDGPAGDPSRLAAWLEQIRRWDDEWASVGTVDWAAIAVAAETAAGHELREDAVHFEREPLVTILAQPLVDQLLSRVTALEADARQHGCLVGSGDHKKLNLASCGGAG